MFHIMRIYLLSAIVFLIFDLFWLLVVSQKMYQQFIGHLMGDVRIMPAIIFYFLYVSGVLYFVILPGIEKNSLIYTLLSGAFFGLICYATYDLTNLSTLKNWPVTMTLIDLAWGTFVTGSTSGIVYLLNKFLFERG
ncbi:DUF2177 family protein [Enterococcus alcedinis]|uniref:Membrane protein n=1 Tax=Enterococcus alcedinis TaxID=1274384 RepID=A0A917N4U3_9ENTE|nr:DUF2177 family protein [Enterococcus alcedinis]MBP2102566.1 putative membrane protein [Enterococcus alcedinis]GGI66125.1 membrane protein [Enterococcus alcedinis]